LDNELAACHKAGMMDVQKVTLPFICTHVDMMTFQETQYKQQPVKVVAARLSTQKTMCMVF